MKIVPKYSTEDVPKGSFVIREINTKKYVHVKDDNCGLYLKKRMIGCLVLMDKETAEIMIGKINNLDIRIFGRILNKFEPVPFEEAYNKHGLIDKQIVYN